MYVPPQAHPFKIIFGQRNSPRQATLNQPIAVLGSNC